MGVTTLGDLLVDVIVRLDGPIALDADTFSQISITAGGQAANVAAWAAALGERARLVCARCPDRSGALVEAELTGRGVAVCGPTVSGHTGTVVSLTQADGTRSMLTDRGSSAALTAEGLDPEWLKGSRWLHVSGYAMAQEPLRAAALHAAALARELGCQVSVDLASTSVVEAFGAERAREWLCRLEPALVLANGAEHAALELAGDAHAELAPTYVVKRGAAGCTVYSAGTERTYDAHQAVLVDATGAGDAFAGGYLTGGVDAALAAAARCVSTSGAMPR